MPLAFSHASGTGKHSAKAITFQHYLFEPLPQPCDSGTITVPLWQRRQLRPERGSNWPRPTSSKWEQGFQCRLASPEPIHPAPHTHTYTLTLKHTHKYLLRSDKNQNKARYNYTAGGWCIQWKDDSEETGRLNSSFSLSYPWKGMSLNPEEQNQDGWEGNKSPRHVK